MTRDYSKFLDENGKLDISLIPRKEYTDMVTEYRRRDDVIREVFGRLYWLWDLEQLEKEYLEQGEEVPLEELAQEVLNGMEDDDWWQAIAAFEAYFIEHFNDDPGQWSAYLDHVYDEQEQAGWVRRQ